jgi:hypothetical protein
VTEASPDLPVLRIKKEAGELSEEGRRWLDFCEGQLRDNREKTDILTHFQNHLAKVYCTSGVGEADGWILDWGLAELAEKRLRSHSNLSSVSSLTSGMIQSSMLTDL